MRSEIYTLEIIPPKEAGGSYQWAIRRLGKLLLRSDRKLPTEDKAQRNGQAQLERLRATDGSNW